MYGASQGPPLSRRVFSAMLLHIWAAMGANLSLRKCKNGQFIEWVGTTITVRPHLGFSAVWIEIHRHTTAGLFAYTERLSLRKGLVDVKEVSHWAAIMKHCESQEAKCKPAAREQPSLTCSWLQASQLRYAGPGRCCHTLAGVGPTQTSGAVCESVPFALTTGAQPARPPNHSNHRELLHVRILSLGFVALRAVL